LYWWADTDRYGDIDRDAFTDSDGIGNDTASNANPDGDTVCFVYGKL
jgi:hypothetical protein